MKTKSIPVLFALLSLLFAGCGLSNAKDPSANKGSTEEDATEAELNGDANRSVNGHKFIDLALPSGTLWAETNIGAKTAADDGDFFAWGETQAKEKYLWDTYKYGTAEAEVTKYNDADALKELGDADDAARVNWGAPCRMPTDAECEELIDKENCTWDLVSRTTSSGEKRFGYEVKSVRNGNTIFLPFGGSCIDVRISENNKQGNYYSRSLLGDRFAVGFYLVRREPLVSSIERVFGCNIRPVVKP